MVASKYLYDEGEDEEVFNDEWAKAGKKLNFKKKMIRSLKIIVTKAHHKHSSDVCTYKHLIKLFVSFSGSKTVNDVNKLEMEFLASIVSVITRKLSVGVIKKYIQVMYM